jgi:hypothetical protein
MLAPQILSCTKSFFAQIYDEQAKRIGGGGFTLLGILRINITALGIMTISIKTLGMLTISITALSMMAISIMTLGTMRLYNDAPRNDTRHNVTHTKGI